MRPAHLLGDGPDKGRHFAGNIDDYLVDLFAPGHQPSGALAEAHLGFPTDILDRLGHVFQAQLQMATDLGRVAIGSGPLNEDPASMSVARLGDTPLPTALPTGVFTGNEAKVAHELTGVRKTGQVAQFGNQGDGSRELDPT